MRLWGAEGGRRTGPFLRARKGLDCPQTGGLMGVRARKVKFETPGLSHRVRTLQFPPQKAVGEVADRDPLSRSLFLKACEHLGVQMDWWKQDGVLAKELAAGSPAKIVFVSHFS